MIQKINEIFVAKIFKNKIYPYSKNSFKKKFNGYKSFLALYETGQTG